MQSSSHDPARFEVLFDDDHAVANAGLVLVATCVKALGIEAAANELIVLGERAGASRPGRKIVTLLHSMVAGGDCIDDVDVLRSGSTGQVLGHRVMAPSTVERFYGRSLLVMSASWTVSSRRFFSGRGRRVRDRAPSR